MPYAPAGLAALVLQPLSCCHRGSSAAISPVEKPKDPSRLQATSRFPEYAEQPAAGATGAGAAVTVFGRVAVVVTGAGAAAGGVVAAGVVAGVVVGSGLAGVRASPREARSSVRTAVGVGVA